MKATARPLAALWRPLLALAIAIALLALLLRRADFTALEAALRDQSPWLWIVAAAGLLGTYGLRAWRLRLEWRRVRLAPWMACMRLVLTHNAALALLPLRSGEAGYVLLVHRQWGVSRADAARSLLWLRLQDAWVLALLGVLLLLPLPLPWRLAAVAALLLVGWLALPWLVRLARRRWARIDRWADALLRDRDDTAGWLLCIANWALKLAVVAAVLASLASIDALAAVRGALGGELAAALPLQAPAGLGTYEAGVWAAAALAGPGGARLIAAALAAHLFAVLVLLAGALLMIVTGWAARSRPTPRYGAR